MKVEIKQGKLEEIKQKALDEHVPILQDESLACIELLLKLIQPTRILEIGTAVGYSASCFISCLGLNKETCIDTIEIKEEMYQQAVENITSLALEDYIKPVLADATTYLASLQDNTYDVVFIDAAKGQYMVFLEQAKRLVKSGGVIIADNVLFKGRVLSDYNEKKHRTAVNRLREYLHCIQEDNMLDSTVLSIGDGIAISLVQK